MSENPYQSPEPIIDTLTDTNQPRAPRQKHLAHLLMMLLLALPTSLFATLGAGSIAATATRRMNNQDTAELIVPAAGGITGLIVFGLMTWLGIYPLIAQKPATPTPPDQGE